MAIDPDTEHHITLSKHLIENAKQERERLLEQIAASQKTIEQSLKLIARLDAAIKQAENP
jgi:DNA polymerase III delta subunit